MHTVFEQMHQTTATSNWKQLQLHTFEMKPEPQMHKVRINGYMCTSHTEKARLRSSYEWELWSTTSMDLNLCPTNLVAARLWANHLASTFLPVKWAQYY